MEQNPAINVYSDTDIFDIYECLRNDKEQKHKNRGVIMKQILRAGLFAALMFATVAVFAQDGGFGRGNREFGRQGGPRPLLYYLLFILYSLFFRLPKVLPKNRE